MWLTIIGLVILGILLLTLETFIPGMVVGICGAIALVVATVLAYRHYGENLGSLLFLAILVAVVGFTVWWIRYAPRSFLARKWTLYDTVPRGEPAASASAHPLMYTKGEALTPLRPSGMARIADKRVDVVTRGEMLEVGDPVEVIAVEGFRVVVRRAKTPDRQFSLL